MQSPPATAVPVFPVHQYGVHQYPQASGAPLLSSVLGLHGLKGPSSGGAAPGQAPGMAASQHGGMGAHAFFMPPHYAGGPPARRSSSAWQRCPEACCAKLQWSPVLCCLLTKQRQEKPCSARLPLPWAPTLSGCVQEARTPATPACRRACTL